MPQQQGEPPLMVVEPVVTQTCEHFDSQGQRHRQDKSGTLSLPIMIEPSTTEVSHGTYGLEKQKLRTYLLLYYRIHPQ